MSLNYTSYIASVANLAVVPTTDANFVQIIPSMIDYAEGRIYRDLNLISTVISDSSATLTANSKNFTLPTSVGVFNTVTQVNVITPVGATISNGTKVSLIRSSLKALNFLYPLGTAPTSPSIPTMYAMFNDTSIAVGAAPGDNYRVEIVGTVRPAALSGSNPTTYLVTYLPDLFVAASMIFVAGFQKNFSSTADDPQSAMSWEKQYKFLLGSAATEEARRRFNVTTNT